MSEYEPPSALTQEYTKQAHDTAHEALAATRSVPMQVPLTLRRADSYSNSHEQQQLRNARNESAELDTAEYGVSRVMTEIGGALSDTKGDCLTVSDNSGNSITEAFEQRTNFWNMDLGRCAILSATIEGPGTDKVTSGNVKTRLGAGGYDIDPEDQEPYYTGDVVIEHEGETYVINEPEIAADITNRVVAIVARDIGSLAAQRAAAIEAVQAIA